jgi:uncharacterized protein YggE
MKSAAWRNAGVLTLTAALLGFAVTSMAQTIKIDKNNRTIAVTASEKATADADQAVVHVGFQIFGPDETSTYAEGSKTSNAIIDALKKAGVPDKAIESENQNLQRNTYHDPQESQMDRDKKQFVLNQSWTVKTKPDDAAKILNIAVAASANQSGQIDWQYQDMNALQAKAASNSLAKAQAIAQQMALGLNVKLSGLIFASNQAPESPVRPMEREYNFLAKGAMTAPAPPPLAITPRQIEESATVYAVFAIE